MVQSAAGIFAYNLGEYTGGIIKIWSWHLRTPKMHSMTLWAEAWQRLKVPLYWWDYELNI